jgi:hypothetical protein
MADRRDNTPDDAIERLREWGDQQYVEGYYTGRRALDLPILRGRSRGWGWTLIAFGLLLVAGFAATLSGGGTFDAMSLALLIIGALQIVAGMRLLRR